MWKNYTEIFEEFLDTIDFTLVKYKSSDEEYDPWRWGLVDRQGANLGDIMECRFVDAENIIDNLDMYINDYIYKDLEGELDAYDVELDLHEIPDGAYEWLKLINDKEFRKDRRNLRYIEEHKFEFDILDMIVNHINEVDLEECYYEEAE